MTQDTHPMMLIHASEVAACVGKNPYTSRDEMMRIIMKRMDAHLFAQSGLCLQEDLEKMIVTDARRANPVVDKLVDSAYKSGSADQTKTVHDVLQHVTSCVIKTDLTRVEQDTIIRHCRTEAFRKFGTIQETHAMEGLEQTVGVLTKDDVYTKRKVEGVNNLYVGGRIDGFATPLIQEGDESTVTVEPILIEIKNRMNRLFRKVVMYERIQVMTYMFIFRQSKAKLVERLGTQVMVHDIIRDDDAWSNIEIELQEFATDVFKMLSR